MKRIRRSSTHCSMKRGDRRVARFCVRRRGSQRAELRRSFDRATGRLTRHAPRYPLRTPAMERFGRDGRCGSVRCSPVTSWPCHPPVDEWPSANRARLPVTARTAMSPCSAPIHVTCSIRTGAESSAPLARSAQSARQTPNRVYSTSPADASPGHRRMQRRVRADDRRSLMAAITSGPSRGTGTVH